VRPDWDAWYSPELMRGALAGGSLLAVGLSMAACFGQTPSDEREPATGGAASSIAGGANGAAATSSAGAAGTEACGQESEACCPPSTTLALVLPCDDQLQCCNGVCRLSCSAPEEPVDGWSDAPDCDLAPYRVCEQDDDCTLVEHRANCCGSTRLVAVGVSAVPIVTELIAGCAPTTTCECEAVLVTDQGSVPAGTDVLAVCRDGSCATSAVIE
jgi:hypothetical protein